MSIEQFLLRERRIPLDDAAHFFADLTKNAEWTDPPDMTGALEGQFVAPVEQVLHKLKDVCTAKLRLMMAYYTYAQSLNDHAWGGVKKEFYDHAEMEQEGAEYYLKRAAVLGGPIQLDALEPPPPSTNADSIFTMLVRAEQEGILAQRELRQMVGDENPMKVGIEEQMLKDQHHLDELFQMMSPEHRLALEQAGAVGGEVPGTVPVGPPAQGVPEEASKEPAEKNASFQLASAVLKLAADKSDAELREVGRQRAVTNLSAEAHREAGRRGERAGHTLGSVAGLVGGAAAGKKYVGGKAGTIAGAVLGGVAGGRVGRELGSEHDIKKNAAASYAGVHVPVLQDGQRSHYFGVQSPGAVFEGEHLDEDHEGIANDLREAYLHFNKGPATLSGGALGALAGTLLGGGVALHPGLPEAAVPLVVGGGTVLGGLAGGAVGRRRAISSGDHLHDAALRALQKVDWAGAAPSSGKILGQRGGFATTPNRAPVHVKGHEKNASFEKAARELGSERDIHKNAGIADIASKFVNKEGITGLGAATIGGGIGIAAAPSAYRRAKAKQQAKVAFELAKAKLAFAKVADEYGNDESMSAPSAGELEPTNYLRAEMLGRQVQEQNEASYYRDLLSSTRQENATTAQQLSDMQAQMQQLQEQQAQVGAQVTQAMQHASMAQDQATQQAFEAAKARIGAQQLRQMMFEVASQDPASLGESALGPSMPGSTEGSDPTMGQDPAASNPTLTADPNGASTQPGDGQPSDTSQGQAPTLQDSTTAAAQSPTQSGPGGASTPISVKVGSFAPALLGGGLGAITGAAGSVMAGRGAPALREKVEGMAAGQDGTFAAAARMAAAKAALAGAELAERHPVGAALTGAAQGALGGAAAGPALMNQGRQFMGNISEVGKALLSKVR